VVLTYNAALNRPAYQSSLYTDRDDISYPAHLANDGSRDTAPYKGTKCASTQIDTNPWWMVDLLLPTTILRVDFTSRQYDQYGRPSVIIYYY